MKKNIKIQHNSFSLLSIAKKYSLLKTTEERDLDLDLQRLATGSTKMRIITTFNDDMYQNTGKPFIASVKKFMPEAEVLIYEELEGKLEEDVSSVKVTELPKLKEVFEKHKDVISPHYGGSGDFSKTNKWEWQYRWFGWFRKIVAQHHAITVDPYDGYNVFFDCDVRLTRDFTNHFIEHKLEGKPVGLFKGKRKAVEAAMIIVDGRSEAVREMYEYIMELFTSGNFKMFERWDDSFILANMMGICPHLIHDLALDVTEAGFTNSNGHYTNGHVIPFTAWGQVMEHDKGIHWHQGIVPRGR